VVHTDMTNPYCPEMIEVASKITTPFPLRKGGVMVVTEGPRFETAAEVSFCYAGWRCGWYDFCA